MSFTGSNNPPWQRSAMGNAGSGGGPQQQIPSLQSQMGLPNPNMGGFQAQQSIYSTNMSMAGSHHQQQQHQQNNSNQMSMIPSLVGGGSGGGNMNSNQMYNQTVAYPTRGGGGGSGAGVLNPNAFGGHQNNATVPGQQTTSRIGVVTKIQNDFGFIDEEVFFHKNSCKGNYPKLGDRVLVEAAFSTNAAFKWNATRVQLMGANGGGVGGGSNNASVGGGIVNARNHHQQGSGGGGGGGGGGSGGGNQRQGSGYNAVPPPNAYAGGFERSGQPRRGNVQATSPLPHPRRSSPNDKHSSRNHDSRADDEDRKRRREEREKEKDRVKEKRDHSVEKRDHSPSSSRRAASPKRRRTRVIPRYMVQIPKVTLDMVEGDVLELRRRYTNLYIPSDFFFTEIRWSESFPPNATFSIQKPCAFHIMHRSVEPVCENDAIVDPPDVDYLFSAKVMLMGIPPMSEMYRKCFSTAEEKEKEREEERSYVHPTRLINFLVGIRGKNEAMAIGGPWSQSLDGPNPERDPSVLIRTAIRTCKALTGIDLTPCTQWYRFVELYYRRSESVRKGRTIPARVETVVIYLPDVRSCVPTRLEWDALNVSYKQKLEQVVRHSETTADAAAGLGNSNSDTNQSNSIVAGDSIDGAAASATAQVTSAAAAGRGSGATAEADGDATTEKDETVVVPAAKRNPSNFADLDPKTMKLVDLREELDARNLSSRGLKPQLVARLSKVLKTEETESNLKDEENDVDEPLVADTDEAPTAVAAAAINDDGAGNGSGGVGGSGGVADIDMADIMVIDEYDSTKPDVKKSKEDEPKPLDERERRLLEKRYQLPENPHLVIHPSRSAKSGKFFCNVMSLSILLDYRPEDSKEHSFEVSLFAELFNEMLMRDFGFNIYKAMCAMPEKTKEEEEAAATEKENSKDTKDRKDSDASREKRSRKEDDTSGADAKGREDAAAEKIDTLAEKEKSNELNENKDRRAVKESGRSADTKDKDRKRRRDDDADDDTQSIRSSDPKKKDKDRLKHYTADPELLLSFVYFDQTHCGYIFEKDIEELFYTLGLHLSRAQTRKLVSKVVSRDSLFYRKLTDKPREEKPADGTLTAASAEPTAASQDTAIELVPINIDELSQGNKRYMPIFQTETNKIDTNSTTTNNHANDQSDESTSQTGMVLYKGGFVDIEKLLDQMRRSEKARDDTEQMLVDLRKTNAELAASNTRSKDKIKDLQSDVKSYSRKLSDVEQALSSTTKKSGEYHSILSSVYDRVSVVFAKSERTTSKNDTNRDKDKDRGDKKERSGKDKEITEDREKDKEEAATKDTVKTEVKKE